MRVRDLRLLSYYALSILIVVLLHVVSAHIANEASACHMARYDRKIYQAGGTGQRPVLRVALCEEAPYQFWNSSGVADGLLVEVFDFIARRCGYTVEYVPRARLSHCIQALRSGDADLILGVPSYNGFNLEETVELYSSSMVLLGPAAFSEAIQKRIPGLSVGYNFYTLSNDILYRIGDTPHVVSSRQYTLLQYLQAGKADVIIVDRLIANWFLRQQEDTTQKILIDFVGTIQYTVAVGENNRALLRELNTSILELRLSGDYSSIVQRWNYSDSTRQVVRTLRRLVIFLMICVGCAVAYNIIGINIRRVLQREVEAKTIELQWANETLAQRYEQLQADADLCRQIIENSSNGLVLIDRELRVQLMNRRAAKLARADPEAAALRLTELHRFRELVANLKQDIFHPATGTQSLTFSLEPVQGQKEILRGRIHRVISNNKITGALLSLEDITFEVQAAQKNFEREKNHILNRIIAGIAHEIKNPLMSIRTYAGLINEKIEDPDFRASFAEFVPRESDRINQLAESLLNYAKPVQGGLVYTDLFELVRDCAYLSGVAGRTPRIRFQLHAQGSFLIYANPNQVKQILINIIINGIESIERRLLDNGDPGLSLTLRVTAFIEGQCGFVEVWDEGTGMSEYVLEHCTDPFYTTKQKGSGLGLALSNQYIRENGGSLEIKSELNRYTRIVLRFGGDI